VSKIGIDIEKAKQILEQGKLVAIPTETVYGLAANATNQEAVLKIFEAKKRPHFDPLIIHTHNVEKVRQYVEDLPQWAEKLAKAFWPGPLTLLLPKKNNIPDIVTSGLPQVAVRIPAHPLTLELLQQLDFPLAAPSANLFGHVSPTTAQHVADQLLDQVDYILDGGPCKVGVESTIVGSENGAICVYRLGGLPVEEIEKLVGKIRLCINQSSDPKAPGMLKSHYAPAKPLWVGDVRNLLQTEEIEKTGVISFRTDYRVPYQEILSEKGDLEEAAFNLFAAIRKLDASPVERIVAEVFPDNFLGKAINDRLKRAAHR
jgi:L-threonylcarbamoyladenylate synthase